MSERIDVLHVDDDPSVLDLAEAYFDSRVGVRVGDERD